MTIFYRGKAPPGQWRTNTDVLYQYVWPFGVGMLLTLFFSSVVTAQNASERLPKESAATDHRQILEWVTVTHYEHPGFAKWCMALGDINTDGYDDFAIGTGYDTTFIFLGGDPFDHEPAFFLSGGASGLACGDFNGDGRRDLVTGVAMSNSDLDPHQRGRISVYFGKEAAPFLGPEPDLVMRGDTMQFWGSATFPESGNHRSGLQVVDYNGDGHDDLLATTFIGGLNVRLNPIIFFGGPGFDSIPDVEIQGVNHGEQTDYPLDILIGDLNGDGCEDILLHGNYLDSNTRVNYWDLFLGNREGVPSAPYRMLRSDTGWSPEKNGVAAVFDVNGDGIDDVIDPIVQREYGDLSVFLGSSELPVNIEPNDSIPNPWPVFGGIVSARSIHPVGDMDGDGRRDLLISWATFFCRDCSLYYLYPMEPDGLSRAHTGHIGMIPYEDWVVNGACDVGDVNGDGCDDVVFRGRGGAEPPTIGWWFSRRFIICLGARNLSTAVPPLVSERALDMELYPNPVFSGTTNVTLRLRNPASGPVTVEIIDLLGRTIHGQEKDLSTGHTDVSIPVSGLRPGSYFVFLRQGNAMARTVLSIL